MVIHGTKLRMTQIFREREAIGVTPILVGDAIGSLKEGEVVAVQGTTKGKGFQGVVKRHGFGGGPKTHGQKNRQRAPGSIGNTTPQRVLPGRRMAGRMGGVKRTIKNMKVVKIDGEKKVLFLSGATPGAPNTKVIITKPDAKS